MKFTQKNLVYLLKYIALCPVSHRSMCKLNQNNTTRQLTTAVYFISPDLGFFFLISQLPFIVCFPEAHQMTLQNTQKVKKKKMAAPKNSRIRTEGAPKKLQN